MGFGGGGSGSFVLPNHTHTNVLADGGALVGATSLIDLETIDTYLVPSGAIAMWSGLLANIPTGWVLCDGNNGTPNLIAKFVRSINTSATEAGSTGGADSVTLSTSQMPSHSHSVSGNYTIRQRVAGGLDTDGVSWAGRHKLYAGAMIGGGDTAYSISGGSAGSGGSHENRPAYYELAYIMKT